MRERRNDKEAKKKQKKNKKKKPVRQLHKYFGGIIARKPKGMHVCSNVM